MLIGNLQIFFRKVFFFSFRAIPVIYRSSQARGRIIAAAASLCQPQQCGILDLCHNLWQCQILNPLGKARDRTYVLMDTSRVLNPLSHNGNSLWDAFMSVWRLPALEPCSCRTEATLLLAEPSTGFTTSALKRRAPHLHIYQS